MADQDASGAAFDPALHFVKDGQGVLRKDGLWRKRPGGKKPQKNPLLERIEQLEAALKVRDERPDAKLAAELRMAKEDLAKLKAPVPFVPVTGPGPKQIPYRGLVRALADCYIGAYHRQGEVFHVNVPALWSDDPYEAVTATGTNEIGQPIVEPALDAVRIDQHFRPRSQDLTNPSFLAEEIKTLSEALRHRVEVAH